MKTIVYCVMVCVVVSTISVKADLPVVLICTATSDQVQPDIDGDWIVWHDARNGTSNWNVFGYILTEPNEVPICTVAGNQRYIAVSGNIAVWQDERDSQRDIRAFDLLNRTPLDLPNMPLNDGVYQRYPDVRGNSIIYEHKTDGFYNLFVYDCSTSTSVQIAPAGYNQINSAIDGGLVVWTENRGTGDQVYYRDIQQVSPATKISGSTYGQYYPAVSGEVVVWAEDRETGTGYDIYGYDLSEHEEFVVYSGSGNQTRPAISGNLIVWQDESKGTSNFDIWGMDMTTGSPFAIDTTSSHDQNSAISGRRVVWQRGTSNFDIYMAEIPTPTVMVVVSPIGGEQILAGSQMTVDWEMTEGTLPDEVKIEFSPDNEQSWQILEPNVPADVPYVWKPVADVDSQQCKIQVSAVGDATISDISEAFTIFQCSGDLTADVTGDCFVDIDDFAAMASQWLKCGNPYNENWCIE